MKTRHRSDCHESSVNAFQCPACLKEEAVWRKETAQFARTPNESLEKFKARWRRHMFAMVGATPRAAMPPVVTMASYTASIRTHHSRRIVTAFAAQHKPDRWTGRCQCVECELVAWKTAVATAHWRSPAEVRAYLSSHAA
jgi:hypothetical protein